MIRKNPFSQRRSLENKRRKAAAKVVIILSPRSQQRENARRAAQASLDAQSKQQRLEARAQEEHLQKERRRNEGAAAVWAVRETTGVASPPKASPPKVIRRRPPSASSTTPVKPAPTPAVSFEALRLEHAGLSNVEFKRVLEDVRTRRDAAVLRATDDGVGVQTWQNLEGEPPLSSPSVEAWRRWQAPANWIKLVDLCGEEDPDDKAPIHDDAMVKPAGSGAYNAVLVPTKVANLEDGAQWPPQLLDSGRKGAYVIRLTKNRPFPISPGGKATPAPNAKATHALKPIYRFMRLEDAVLEMATALYAAAIGVGSPVLAAVLWAVETGSKNKSPTDKKLLYGLLLVLKRASGDMAAYQRKLLTRFPPANCISGPSKAFASAVTDAAKEIARLCYRVANEGFVNFDIKPANILMRNNEDNTFYFCDFDPVHFVRISSRAASIKACFFLNVLLLCMHVRSHGTEFFGPAFLEAFAPTMLSLWQEAVHHRDAFGRGADWLRAAQLHVNSKAGQFDLSELRNLSEDEEEKRHRRHFEMIFFEYSFSNAEGRLPPKKCTQWTGWKKGAPFPLEAPLLVPQLLTYCFFPNAVPLGYSALLSMDERPR